PSWRWSSTSACRFANFFARSFRAVIFFFQAEDGIRDFHVTGVQTCALPISFPAGRRPCPTPPLYALPASTARSASTTVDTPKNRSEERRVGKEWTTRRGLGR